MAPRAQPRDTSRITDWRESFLKALALTGVVQSAADAANIGRKTAYRERDKDPEFAKQWDDALESALDTLEKEAWRRAVEGVEEPSKFGLIRKYSDTLLIFLLKANRPAKYRDTYKAPVPQPPEDLDLNADVSIMTPAEREVYQIRLDQYLAKVRAAGGQ